MGVQNIILTVLLITVSVLNAQVYDHDPIRHSNFEINPAYMANGRATVTSNFVHRGSAWSSNKFFYDACRISFYNRNYFTGLGLTVNNTNINDSAAYRYAGIGAAYRVVMFNKIYVKAGLLYKLMSYKSAPGNFGYYSFKRVNDGEIKNKTNDNTNVSIAFSSVEDKYYISAGILNYQPWRTLDTNFAFPQYYFVNAGDLGKIMKLSNWEITYTAFTKKYPGGNYFPFSQYVTIIYRGFHLTRYSDIGYGSRVGWSGENYIHANPVLSYYKKLDRRTSYVMCQLMFDLGYDPVKNKLPFQPNPQFNLTYQF